MDLATAPYHFYGLETEARAGSQSALGLDLFDEGSSSLVIGAYLADPSGYETGGMTYVFKGGIEEGEHVLSSADLSVSGEEADARVGYALSGNGDINDDGIADLAIGAWGVDGNGQFDSGAVYIFFGSASLSGSLPATDADIVVFGEEPLDHFGWSVDILGDLNDDGVSDIVIGSPLGQGAAVSSGEVFVFWGGSHLHSGAVLNPALADLHLKGTQSEAGAGHAVATGDINNDLIDDLIIGSPNKDILGRYHCGMVHAFLGRSDFNPQESFLIGDDYDLAVAGATQFDGCGAAVDVVGDFNGDGFGDLVIGAPFAGPGGNENQGQVFVIAGRLLESPVLIDGLDEATSSLSGEDGGDLAGYAVSGIGDFDGNGRPDFVVGAPGADPLERDGAGAVYLVYGTQDSFPVGDALVDASGRQYIGAAAGDEAGASCVPLFDFSGDGIADLAIGAPGTDYDGVLNAGAVHVVYGEAVIGVPSDDVARHLRPPFPTPTTGAVRVMLHLPVDGWVDAFVSDVGGRRVRSISSSERREGPHELRWDGLTDLGEPVPSGVYFLHVRGAGVREVRRLVVLR